MDEQTKDEAGEPDRQEEPVSQTQPRVLADERLTPPPFAPQQGAAWRQLSRGQLQTIALVVALAGSSMIYRAISRHHLEQTSLLFIGLPAFLAIVLAAAPKAKTLTGGVMRGVTLALLLSGILLGEGFICIVMAAPLFYIVALLVVGCVKWWQKSPRKTLSCVALVLLPMALEGTRPELSFARDEQVTVSEVVTGSTEDVRARLAEPMRLGLALPVYLRLKFPRPVSVAGGGLAVGDERRVHFAGGEGEPGDLVMRVVAIEDGAVRMECVSDRSKIAHWLTWKTSDVQWKALDAQHTRVTWTLSYERRLDPAWYFGPWERYAVRKSAEYMIAANAGPR